MMGRCYSKGSTAYYNYGGRGILVCRRWHKFEAFIEDMGQPTEGMTLERLDPNKGYYPENCVWATREAQGYNKRNSVADSVWACLGEAVKYYNEVSYSTAWARVRRGVPIDTAASLPARSALFAA